MASNFWKSIVYLTGFTGLGYVLLLACTPSESELERIRKKISTSSSSNSEVIKKREQFSQVLQAAATEKPIYLRTKADLKEKSFDEKDNKMDATDLIQERCDRKIEMLIKRDLERKQDLERDQASKRLANAENEQLGYFECSFAKKRQEIEDDLNSAKNMEYRELPLHFDAISKNILTLQKYVAASNLFLRGYDIKIYQQVLQNLANKSKDLEEELLPKKKFGFKNRKSKPNGVSNNINGKESKVDEVDSSVIKKKLLENMCDFVNETNKSLFLGGNDIFKKDVALTGLENCTVKLFGSPSTLHINSVKNCYIFTGPVSTSIFAENCENCTFVIACQQLRLHSSKDVNIYLHVTSRAIMEDCNGISLAPYNLTYENIGSDFKNAGLDKSINNWTAVDDFNWLNIERASPHWGVLQEDKRVNCWEKY